MHFVEFPNLGLHFEMKLQLFSVGPLTVRWYGIITALAFLVIVVGTLRESPKFGISRDDMIDMMLVTTPVGIIGARLFYVLLNWSDYAYRPAEIYKTWHGGLAIYGGIVFGIITIYLFCRYRKLSTLKLLDHLVVYLVLGQVMGRWSNFVNQELFGPNTTLPWGMTGDIIQSTIRMEGYPGVDPSMPVHPLFLYESLWNLVAFFILLWFRKRKKLEGEVFTLYMIMYGGARFIIDSLRFDLMVGNVNINRVFGLLFVISFSAIMVVRRKRQKASIPEEASVQPSLYREVLNRMQQEQDEATEGMEQESEHENGMDGEMVVDKESTDKKAEESKSEEISDSSGQEEETDPEESLAVDEEATEQDETLTEDNAGKDEEGTKNNS